MPIAIAHFGVGYAAGVLAALAVTEYDSSIVLSVGVISGVFAMIPDVWRFTTVPKHLLHDSLLADVFIAHRVLDTVFEPLVGAKLMGVFGVALMLVALGAAHAAR